MNSDTLKEINKYIPEHYELFRPTDVIYLNTNKQIKQIYENLKVFIYMGKRSFLSPRYNLSL